MAQALTRCGDFKTSYRADSTIFPSARSRTCGLLGILLLVAAPLEFGGAAFLSDYWITLMIQIGYLAIAALGLNILVGFTGQISLGHSAFFGFGAFASAYLNNTYGIPVFFSIPLAALWTTAVGLIVGIPACPDRGPVPGHRHARLAVHPSGLLRPRRLVYRRLVGIAGGAVLDPRVRGARRPAILLCRCSPTSSCCSCSRPT